MADEIILETRRATISPSAGLTDDAAQKLLRIINTKHARTPLSLDQLYIFPGTLSTQAIDYYGTRMAPSSLKRYLDDVRAGIALMNSHRTGGWSGDNAELPVGRIFEGVIEGDAIKPKRGQAFDDAPGASLGTWNYMLRGIRVTDVANDDLIAAIDGGTIKDMSISFTIHPDGQYICSVCGRDYLNRGWSGDESERCTHLAFMDYDGQRAFVWVEDGRALEGSLVYAGATPGAMIRKAEELAPTLDRLALGWLEEHYQRRLLGERTLPVSKPAGTPAGATHRGKEATPMFDRSKIRELLAKYLPAERLAQVGALADDEEFARAGAQALGELVTGGQQREADLRTQIETLTPDAENGRQYRADLVDAAVKARVRAQGTAFDAEQYRGVLAKADLAFVKSERVAWDSQAEQLLRGGPGQHRTTTTQTGAEGAEVRAPAQAYQ